MALDWRALSRACSGSLSSRASSSSCAAWRPSVVMAKESLLPTWTSDMAEVTGTWIVTDWRLGLGTMFCGLLEPGATEAGGEGGEPCGGLGWADAWPADKAAASARPTKAARPGPIPIRGFILDTLPHSRRGNARPEPLGSPLAQTDGRTRPLFRRTGPAPGRRSQCGARMCSP